MLFVIFSSEWQSTKEITNYFIVVFSIHLLYEDSEQCYNVRIVVWNVHCIHTFLCWLWQRIAQANTHVHAQSHTLCNHPHTHIHNYIISLNQTLINTIKMQKNGGDLLLAENILMADQITIFFSPKPKHPFLYNNDHSWHAQFIPFLCFINSTLRLWFSGLVSFRPPFPSYGAMHTQ